MWLELERTGSSGFGSWSIGYRDGIGFIGLRQRGPMHAFDLGLGMHNTSSEIVCIR